LNSVIIKSGIAGSHSGHQFTGNILSQPGFMMYQPQPNTPDEQRPSHSTPDTQRDIPPSPTIHSKGPPPILAVAQEANPPTTSIGLRVFSRFMLLLILLLLLLAVPWFLENISYHLARGRQQAARESLEELTPTRFARTSRLVAATIQQSVVDIIGRNPKGAKQKSPHVLGQGCGVIVDEEGYILTNYHVVRNTTQLTVHYGEGRQATAEVVGVDAYTDLAVLKIDAENLVAASWGDSEVLAQGDPVWAMGSPWGLDNSVSFGIVSAMGRHGIGQAKHHTLLQTDAMLQPGNSGGALVNAKGELIGINTAIVGESFRGISFAIPSNMAREIYSRLKNDGEIPRGWLGVQLATLPRSSSYGEDHGTGAIVVYVFKSSPADVAGIRSGDIIKVWQSKTIKNAGQLSQLAAQTMAGDTVQVSLLRGEEELSLSVTVGRRPALPQ